MVSLLSKIVSPVNVCSFISVLQNVDQNLSILPLLNLNIESYNNLLHLKDGMDIQIQIFINNMKESKGTDLPIPKGKDVSHQCNFNGFLKREMNINGSYFYCECLRNYVGENCEISPLIYNTILQYVKKVLQKLKTEMAVETHIEKRVFIIKTLILAMQFKVDLEIIELTIELLREFMKKHFKLKKSKEVFMLFDRILINLVTVGEEVKRKIRHEQNADIGLERVRKYVFHKCHQTLKLLKKSTEIWYTDHSFLSFDLSSSNCIETKSFSIFEFDLIGYSEKNGYEFRNPNFDHYFKAHEKNRLFLHFNKRIDQDKDFLTIHAMTISSFFYTLEFETMRLNCLSNLVLLRYSDPVFGVKTSQDINGFIDMITIEFEIYYLPIEENVKDSVICAGFNLDKDVDPVFGKTLSFNEERKLIRCEFMVYYELSDFMFGVYSKVI